MQKTPDFMPDFRANLPRTSHVLSHDLGLTCTVAHLNPVFHTIMNPGETIKVGFNYEVRTMPLEAAAFGDFICHTEYFFVPMQLLYQPFDSVVYGITDQFSSQFVNVPNRDLPVIDMSSIIGGLYSNRGIPCMYYPETGYPVESTGQSAIRLLDLLGFCPIGVATPDANSGVFYNPNVFPYQVLAYNCIYQYYYRLDSREVFDQQSFNWDKYYNQSTPITTYNQNYFLMKYRPLDNDYFTDIKVSPIVDVLNLADKNSFSAAQDWLSRSSNVVGDAASSNPGILSTFSQLLNTSSPDYVDGQQSITAKRADGTPIGFYNPLKSDNDGKVYTEDSNNTRYNIRVETQHSHDIYSLNTANIRALFASEKLWAITGRAKKNYDDQNK